MSVKPGAGLWPVCAECPGDKMGHVGSRGGRFYHQGGGSGLTLGVGAQWALRMSLNLRHRATEVTRCHSQAETP